MSENVDVRESWLQNLSKELAPMFQQAGYALPEVVRFSVGWPAKGGALGKSLGECWDPSCAADGAPHIFISPKVDAGEVAHVVVHELLHAVMFCRYPDRKPKVGHGKLFAEGCNALGLEGDPKATVAGEILGAQLRSILSRIGTYPHSVLTPLLKEKKTRKGYQLVCGCVPKRVLKGAKEAVEGPPVTCAGCSKVMTPERTGGEDEPEPEAEDPDQGKLFPTASPVGESGE